MWCRPFPLVFGLLAGCGTPVYRCDDPLPPHEAVPAGPFLRQVGTTLVGADGAPTTLNGVNLGGWLLWEAWIWGVPLQVWHLDRMSESWMQSRLVTLYGEDVAAELQARLRAEWVTDADLVAIAAAGFDTVRLPVNHRVLEDETGWALVDGIVAGADAAGLRVVIDLHGAPGGQSAFFVADPDPVTLWDDPDARAATVDLWGAIAARYADAPAVVAYDLLNEPDPPDDEALIALYVDLIAAVRAEDPDHLVMLEGSSFARDFTGFTERLDPNMAYQGHLYTSLDGKAEARVAGFAELATCHDVPVWLGEFGEDDPEYVGGLVSAVEAAGLAGWAFWPWKKVPNGGAPGLREIDPPADWITLLEDLTDTEQAPGRLTVDEARKAVDDFVAASAPERLTAGGMDAALGVE